MSTRAVLDLAWSRQGAWSRAASEWKSREEQMSRLALVLLVLAAACGALGVQDSWFSVRWQRGWGLTAAVSMAVAGGLYALFLTSERTRQWTSARQASESLKALVYVSLAMGSSASPLDPEEIQDRVDEIEHRVVLFTRHPATATPRELPPVHDGPTYLTERVHQQRLYHDAAAGRHEATARRLRTMVLTLSIAGAGLATAGGWGADTEISAWIAALASGSAAITAHASSGRFDQLANSYFSTAHALDRQAARFEASDRGAEATARLVRVSEQILASQNDSWIDLVNY